MIKKSFLFAATWLLVFSTQVQSEIISADGLWHSFDVDSQIADANNLTWIDLEGNTLSFEFTLTDPAYLTVVDAGFAGDRFTVYDHNVLNVLGQTASVINNYPDSIGLDFDNALTNGNYSYGIFLLGPGHHVVSGVLSVSAIDDKGIALNATVGAVKLSAVPLPAAAWLFLTGTSLMGLLSRFRLTGIRE